MTDADMVQPVSPSAGNANRRPRAIKRHVQHQALVGNRDRLAVGQGRPAIGGDRATTRQVNRRRPDTQVLLGEPDRTQHLEFTLEEVDRDTPGDEAGLRRLGVNLTSDPNFSSKNLFIT
jgi:hypothetical protein